jgi:hypothetical protein
MIGPVVPRASLPAPDASPSASSSARPPVPKDDGVDPVVVLVLSGALGLLLLAAVGFVASRGRR